MPVPKTGDPGSAWPKGRSKIMGRGKSGASPARDAETRPDVVNDIAKIARRKLDVGAAYILQDFQSQGRAVQGATR